MVIERHPEGWKEDAKVVCHGWRRLAKPTTVSINEDFGLIRIRCRGGNGGAKSGLRKPAITTRDP